MAMKLSCSISDAHPMPIRCVAYNSYRQELFSAGNDWTIKVWDIESGRLLRIQQQHSNWVMDLLYVPPPVKMLFSCSLDGNILVWSDKGKLLQVVEFGGPVFCLAWDNKRRQLIAGGRGAVQLYLALRSSATYLQTDSERKAIAYGEMICGAPFENAGLHIFALSVLKFLELSYCLCNHEDIVQGVCCSEKGKVFSTGIDRAICIFDSERPDETLRRVSNCHEGGITAATFDKDGRWLVTGAYDGTVKIWSQEGHCLDVFPHVTDCVTSIAYVPSTKSYWITGKERSVVVIDPLAQADITEWVADTSSFHDLILNKVFHAQNKDIVIGLSIEREIIVWKYDRFVPHRVLHGHTTWIECMIIAHRTALKTRLLLKDTTDELPESKQKAFRMPYNKDEAKSPPMLQTAFTTSSESKHGIESSLVKLLDGSEDQGSDTMPDVRQTEKTPESIIQTTKDGVLASPSETMPSDGVHLSLLEPEVYSGSADGAILRWLPHADLNKDMWNMAELATPLSEHATKRAIVCILHHPELDVLITGSADAKIRIWHLDGLRSVPLWRSVDRRYQGPDVLKGHTNTVVGMSACKNLVLVSASSDRSLRWWDLSTRLPMDYIEVAQEHPFKDMSYSRSREELATCGGDSNIKIWSERTRKLLHTIKCGAGGGDIILVVLVKWCLSHGGLWVTASDQGTIATWDPVSRTVINTVCVHKEIITALLIDVDNDWILSSSIFDFSIRVFPVSLGKQICQYTGHTDQVHSILYLHTRQQYISGSWDSTLRVWLPPERQFQQVEEKKLDLAAFVTLDSEAPKDAPSDGFDIVAEKKYYVSNYERAHPIIMPRVLANPMNAYMSFLQEHPQSERKTLAKPTVEAAIADLERKFLEFKAEIELKIR